MPSLAIFVSLLSLVLYFGVIWFTIKAARERHRNPALWGFLAVCISMFAFIPLVILGESKAGRSR
jgi:hypothetical protein